MFWSYNSCHHLLRTVYSLSNTIQFITSKIVNEYLGPIVCSFPLIYYTIMKSWHISELTYFFVLPCGIAKKGMLWDTGRRWWEVHQSFGNYSTTLLIESCIWKCSQIIAYVFSYQKILYISEDPHYILVMCFSIVKEISLGREIMIVVDNNWTFLDANKRKDRYSSTIEIV